MIDGVADLKLQHLVELSKLGDRCCDLEEEIEGWLVEHDVVFGGHTIPFVLMPHFISPAQLKAVRRAVGSLSAVLDRLCDAYPDDAALREQLAVPDAEDELIRIDPGYPRPLRVCRLDAFLSGGDVKFLEFNADSPAGIGYTDNLYEGLRRAIDLPRVRGEFETSYTPMLPVLISTLLDAYRHFRAGSPGMPEHPRLALVDVGDSPSVPEFRITCAAAAEAGLEALHCTLDDLSYDGSALHAGGEPVQLVYRRALLEEVGEGPLVDAARDRRVCLVNPFRARVANNKKLFALLDDPRYADRDELEVIRRTIPWTRVLREGPSKYGEWVVDLLAFTSDNRERLVLKPASDYGGHGVALGMETEQAAWDALIEQHGPSADFVVQEYVPVPQEMFPTVEGGHIQMQLKHFNINPFGIGGRYAGMITRISDRAVINVSAGGGLLPSVLGEGEVEMLKRGYDVDENAIRFSNYFHVLRELVHLSCGWLALEPSFERKYGLGDHLHDDARAVTKIKRRLYELRHPSDYPGAPGSELSELLDELEAAASPGEYVHLAYGVAKPTLAAAIRIHLSELDPVTDEPSLRLLRQILARQERHAQQGGQVLQSNIGDVALQDLTPDVGALPIELRGEPRTLRILPPLGDPARDEFVEVTEGGDPYLTDDLYVNGEENHVPTDPEEQRHFFHGLMDAELCAAELMARNSHEHPEMPWDFHVDMARQTWDELRHARVHEILMRTELGCRWGDYPVGFSYFRSIYAYDLLARLVLFNGTSEQKAMWRHSHRRKVLVELGQENVAKVFDYLLADEVPHVHNGVRWGTYLLGGDERAYREKVRELRQGLDRTGAPAGG